jgi:DNA polymerase-3 subunit delta
LAKVNPFFLKDYRLAARNYSRGKLFEVFDILKDYDLRAKGVNVRTVPQIELIKEMILKIVL